MALCRAHYDLAYISVVTIRGRNVFSRFILFRDLSYALYLRQRHVDEGRWFGEADVSRSQRPVIDQSVCAAHVYVCMCVCVCAQPM